MITPASAIWVFNPSLNGLITAIILPLVPRLSRQKIKLYTFTLMF
jgi:hypothetical protein